MIDIVRRLIIPHHKNNYHPHLFHHKAVAVFLLLNLFLGFGSYFFYSQQNNPWLAQIQAAILIQNANAERLDSGLKQLRSNPLLTQAAEAKAKDMAEKGYFSHTSPDGRKPWDFIQEAGYEYTHAGENLAINFIDSDKLHESWMNSETHRKNIIHKDFTEIGIGTATGNYNGQSAVFVVQMFGRQKATKLNSPTQTTTAQVNNLNSNSQTWVAGNYLSSLDGQSSGPNYKEGTKVYVNSLSLNQRTSPGGQVLGQVKKHTLGQVTGPAMVENGVVWLPVKFEDKKFTPTISEQNIAGAVVSQSNTIDKSKIVLSTDNQIITNQPSLPAPILNNNELDLPSSANLTNFAQNTLMFIPIILIIVTILGLGFLLGIASKKKSFTSIIYGLAMLTTTWGVLLINSFLNSKGFTL